MQIVRNISRHQVEISDDTMFMKYVGDFTEQDAVTLVQLMDQHFGQKPFYAIADYTEMGTTTAPARKLLSSWVVDRNPAGAAVYGADLTTRTVAILFQSAVRLVGKRMVPIEFVKNLVQARDWVEAQRSKSRGGS